MNARAIRRAAERLASKANRAEINKQNAEHLTGPVTEEGKAKSSLNAVKTGLTGRTVLLPCDDADAYRNHLANYVDDFAPVGRRESELVQSLADTAWRLDRIPVLEMNIYALGSIQFANHFDDRDPSQRPGLIQLHTFLTYEKQLRNLQIQEGRLRRQREKDLAELKALQATRLAQEQEEADTEPDGFVFSSAESQALLEPPQPSPIALRMPANPESLSASAPI